MNITQARAHFCQGLVVQSIFILTQGCYRVQLVKCMQTTQYMTTTKPPNILSLLYRMCGLGKLPESSKHLQVQNYNPNFESPFIITNIANIEASLINTFDQICI